MLYRVPYRVQGVPFIIIVIIIVLLETTDHDHDHDPLQLGEMRPKRCHRPYTAQSCWADYQTLTSPAGLYGAPCSSGIIRPYFKILFYFGPSPSYSGVGREQNWYSSADEISVCRATVFDTQILLWTELAGVLRMRVSPWQLQTFAEFP